MATLLFPRVSDPEKSFRAIKYDPRCMVITDLSVFTMGDISRRHWYKRESLVEMSRQFLLLQSHYSLVIFPVNRKFQLLTVCKVYYKVPFCKV